MQGRYGPSATPAPQVWPPSAYYSGARGRADDQGKMLLCGFEPVKGGEGYPWSRRRIPITRRQHCTGESTCWMSQYIIPLTWDRM